MKFYITNKNNASQNFWREINAKNLTAAKKAAERNRVYEDDTPTIAILENGKYREIAEKRRGKWYNF